MIVLGECTDKFDAVWLKEAGKSEHVGYAFRIPPYAISTFRPISKSQVKQLVELAENRECEADRDPEAERPITVVGGVE